MTGWAEELSGLGPFFAVEPTPGPGWRPLRVLLGAGALSERVEHTRAVLTRMSGGEVGARVAASTMSLGLFARLLSPVLAADVLGLAVPRPALETVHWRPVTGGPWPLAMTGETAPADLERLLGDVLEPLAEAMSAQQALSPRVLRGNVASALFGAATMLGRARPGLHAVARLRATALLEGPLAGTGTPGPPFVRNSCCLYYRIPGGGYCGDCVLRR